MIKWRGRVRDVAQFGSALGSGPRGRGFKSRRPDHLLQMVEGKMTSRVPTCVGKVAVANARTGPVIIQGGRGKISLYPQSLMREPDWFGWEFEAFVLEGLD